MVQLKSSASRSRSFTLLKVLFFCLVFIYRPLVVFGQTNNANLSGLSASSILLSPAFSSAVTQYSATVGSQVTSITLLPVLSDISASLTINGSAAASGVLAAPVSLVAGSNTITIVVTAADHVTTKTYRVTVTRSALEAINITSVTTLQTLEITSNNSIVVDPAVTVAYSSNINGFRVSIATGLQATDVLSYTGTLPVGITASAYDPVTGSLVFTGTTTAANWQALLRTVKITVPSVPGDRTVVFSAGYLNAFNNGHFYEKVAEPLNTDYSWSQSKTLAAARTYLNYTGYLVTITSADENAFVVQVLDADAWIGATDQFADINAAVGSTLYANQTAAEGHWYWVTGPEKGTNFWNGYRKPPAPAGKPSGLPVGTLYNNWRPGYQPDNGNDIVSGWEHCGQIYETFAGQWNDLGDTAPWPKGYIVEYGGLPNDIQQQAANSVTVRVIQNFAPTDILLSNNAITEGNAVGDLIGNLTAVDANSAQLWETATFSLVSGIGSTDNASFTISGNQLRAGSVFNFSTKNTYTIRVRVTDAYGLTFEKVFTILIRDTPLNVVLSNLTNNYLVCSPAAQVTVDPGLNLSYNKTITGFKVIITDGLQAGDALTYSGTLPAGVSAVAFSSVTGVLEFTGSATVADWQTLLRTVQFKATATGTGSRKITFAAGTLGAFTNAHYYELVSSATAIDWKTAKTQAAARTYLGYRGYLVTITTLAENNFLQQLLDADAWTGASDDYAEINIATNATTYATQALSEGRWYWVTGPEAGTNFSNGNNSPVRVTFMNWASFEPNNASSAEHYMHLYPNGTWNDFVVNDTRVKQYVVEYGGTSGDPVQTPVVSVTMNLTANNAPTNITLSNTVSGENNIAGATIGDLFTTDPDAGDVFTYSLVSGVGATDNSSFTISGTQLKTNVVFNLATKSSYSIRVRSTDRCGQFFENTFTITVVAQETNCSDGIDNDGDGFVDCFDKSCLNSASCSGFFIGNDALCTITPGAAPVFAIAPKWVSPDQSASSITTPIIGDLDRDGTPEVVSASYYGNKITVLNGQTGAIKSSLSLSFAPNNVTIGNVNNSNCGQIIVRGTKGTNWVTYAYDCNLSATPIWDTETLNQPFTTTLSADFQNAGGMGGLADFDGDGKAEFYYRDEILDAATGVRLVKGDPNALLSGFPIAADIVGDSKLELIIGCRIYQVNFGNRTKDAGSLTLVASLPDYYVRVMYVGPTSVADYNLDGYLDVIASGSDGGYNLNTTVFFWDVHNNTVKKFIERESNYYSTSPCLVNPQTQPYLNGWRQGTGRITLADIDGDGKMNATYVSGRYLYALDENFNKKWRIVVNEYSGVTGCTLFDFNGDNAPEIVYRDEIYLYVIKGTDGSIINQRKCLSITGVEYPVVADVDGDGASDICVSCLTDDTKTQVDMCSNAAINANSQIRVFSSAGDPWLSSRRVWNQHAYFSVNINDDLTIPRQQQSTQTRFSSLPCAVGQGQSMNTFLAQTPFLNSNGCPQYIASDIRIVANSLHYTAPVCPATAYSASFTVINDGEGTVQLDVPITFYKGDPSAPGAIRLATVTKNIYLSRGQTQVLSSMNFSVSGSSTELYIVLNDAGTAIPVTFAATTLKECNYANNTYHARITPQLSPITALKVSDNQQCPGAAASILGNGSVQAYVNVGGTPNTTDYNFYWFNSDSTQIDNTPDFTGATYTGLDEATYSVYATHKLTGCQTKAGQVTVPIVTPTAPSVTISEISTNTSCAFPNGKLKAFVTPAASAAGYTYAWYEGSVALISPKISVDSVASNLNGNQVYTVLVTDNRTGCENLQSRLVTNNTVTPVVTTTGSNLQCVISVAGSVQALVNGSAAGHTFNWYIGNSVKPSPDYTGSLVNNLGLGTYTVTAVNSAGCVSAPQQATITASVGFTVTPTVLSNLTSCATPDGSATATVGGIVNGYVFTWFSGQSTNPADQIASPVNLTAGKYTVQAINPGTGCFANGEVEVLDNRIYPVITSTVLKSNDVCDPAVATGGTYNGRITASLSYNGVNLTNYTGLQFKWYNGDTEAAGNINAASTARILDQLNGGTYSFRAIHTASQCTSPFLTVEVLNNTPPLNVAVDISGSTTCDPALANGYIKFRSVNGDTAITTGYTYEWYQDFNTGSPLPGKNTRLLNHLQGGPSVNYSGKITRNVTGCSYLLGSTNVPDNREVISLYESLTKPNTNCTGPTNGEAVLLALNYKGKIDSLLTDYNFDWTGVPAAQAHDQWLTGLAPGNYDVTATNKKDGCQYATTLIVDDYLDGPVLQLSETNVTACAPQQNGAVRADVNLQNPWPGTKSYTGPYAYNLFVANAANNPTAANIISGALITANSVTGKLFNNLSVGDYAFVAVNTSTGCISQIYNSTVSDNTPPIDLVAGTRVLPGDCDVAAGELIGGIDTKKISGTVANPATDRILLAALPAMPDGTLVNISADGILPFPQGASPLLTYYLFNTGPSEIRLATDAAGLNTVDFTAVGNLILHNFSTGGYTFKWYSGVPVASDPGAGPINYLTNPPIFSGSAVNNNLITGLITGTYTVEVTNTVNGCKKLLSHDLQYVNAHVVTVSSVNSSDCAMVTGNGSVTVQITPPAGLPVPVDQTDFTVQVLKAGATLVTYTPIGPVAPEVVTNTLAPGSYELKVTGTYTGKTCAVTNSFQIDAPMSPLLVLDNLITNKSCNLAAADGSFRATVSKALTDVIPVTGFELNINPDPQVVSPVINVAGNTPVTFTGLTGQVYTVTAVSSAGCSTTKTVTIIDQPIRPVVTSSVTGNSSCDINYDGQITITASTPSGPGAGANYDLVWNSDPDGIGGAYRAANAANWAGTYSTLNTDRVGSGLYNFRVQNRISGCFTDASAQVGQVVSTPRITSVTTTGSGLCAPLQGNGSATIAGVNLGLVSDYTFSFGSQPNQLNTVSAVPLLSNALNPGNYFVSGLKNTVVDPVTPGVSHSGCYSEVLSFNVSDIHVNPVIAGAITDADKFCVGGNGRIFVPQATPANYLFSWYTGSGITGTPVVPVLNGTTIENLNAGNYTLVLTDLSTQCKSNASYIVRDEPTVVSIDPAGIQMFPITGCDPVTGDRLSGAARIIALMEDGTTVGTGNYNFSWSDINGVIQATSALVDFNAANAGRILTEGTYFIHAANTVSGCTASAQFNIDDQTQGSVEVAIDNYKNPEICVNAVDGFMTVLGSGTGAGYIYEWYEGNQLPLPTGPVISATNNLQVPWSNFNAGQDSLTYTVRVRNVTDNCFVVEAFNVPLVRNSIIVSATSSPVTFCTEQNGTLTATVVGDNKFDYDYIWTYNPDGTVPGDSIIIQVGSDLSSQTAGPYSVVAADKVDTRCVSNPIPITIQSRLEYPMPIAVMVSPQTFCDPENPNGAGFVSVDGNTTDYIFEWRFGPMSDLVHVGPDFNDAVGGVYSIAAINRSTGCDGFTTLTIEDHPDLPADPVVSVVSQLTSCVENNGELSASIAGLASDYLLQWYNSDAAVGSADATGEFYSNLDSGVYTLTATGRVTKCRSNPVSVRIESQQIYPMFELLMQEANCKLNDGYLTLALKNDAQLDEVLWYKDGSMVRTGPNLDQAGAGNYQVTIKTAFGCEAESASKIISKLNLFNGISKSTDGLNNMFYIDCIEEYPNNKVQIFNRWGTKIYEGTGYDNTTVYFDGKSNAGITLLPDNAPSGTYYYIINKGDGSEKLVGYLELVD